MDTGADPETEAGVATNIFGWPRGGTHIKKIKKENIREKRAKIFWGGLQPASPIGWIRPRLDIHYDIKIYLLHTLK